MSEQQSTPSAVPAHAPRKSGVGRGWIAGALVVGLVVGAAATFGVMTLLPALSGAQTGEPVESALAETSWFAEGDELPASATEPGSRLTIGDSATVLIGSGSGGESVAALTVAAIAELNSEEADFLKSVQPALTGQRLYRIDYTVRFISGDPLAGVRIGGALAPVDAEGAELLRVPVSGWKTCGDAVLPTEVDAVAEGETEPAAVTMCAVAASPEGGADVVGARFAQPGGPYSSANKGQLTWLP